MKEIMNNESNENGIGTEIGNNGSGSNGTEVKNTVWSMTPLEKKKYPLMHIMEYRLCVPMKTSILQA